MRIIDKNNDYYDHIQYEFMDDHFTFDRRDSFILTKKDICNRIWVDRYKRKDKFLLLQICHTFWLMRIDILDTDSYDKCTDYKLDLIINWKNYTSKRELIKLSIIEFDYLTKPSDYWYKVNDNDYKEYYVFNNYRIYVGNEVQIKHIPLLKETGITSLIDGHDIYLSLEQYFSEIKTASERTEPIGATNEDKIVSHGFDTKTSFRG